MSKPIRKRWRWEALMLPGCTVGAPLGAMNACLARPGRPRRRGLALRALADLCQVPPTVALVFIGCKALVVKVTFYPRGAR
jgi:hypothetical protein